MKTESEFQLSPAAAPDCEAMLAVLVAAGHSNTRARRAVIEALCHSGGRVNPAELLNAGRHIHAGLGEVTVYRTLDILLELGVIRKLHEDDGCHSYAVATFTHGHHVICVRCQRAVEFMGCDIGSLVEAVELQTGFCVKEHWLEMFGLCPECQQQVANAAETTNIGCQSQE